MRNYDSILRMLLAVAAGILGMLAMWFFFALIPLIAFVFFVVLYLSDQIFRRRKDSPR
jgi:membrane protein YdbS with pleckstrin-like domain